ncbi:MAG: TNT domain-containing protein [Lachnospiraceae bacterium]|nr:TNT domain-containing protein [Lachnospiraceae bacterium]
MKSSLFTEGKEKLETNESFDRVEQPGLKSDSEINAKAKSFFQNFAKRQREADRVKDDPEKLLLEEIHQLDLNTAPTLSSIRETTVDDLSAEELAEMYENDPGYVNEHVLDYENTLNREENTYSKTGLHTGAVHWGEYAEKETAGYLMIQPGHILSRWGSEKGSFLSDLNVRYEQLEMPVSSDKKEHGFYEAIKPFPVEVSKIATQPWNLQEKNMPEEEVNQYKTPISVELLIKSGYLKKTEV